MLNLVTPMVYLKDYAPPAFLISTVDLDVDLQSDFARVTATLAIRRNPGSADPEAPLILDGDELELESVALDTASLPAPAYTVDAKHLTIPACPISSR